MTRTVVVTGGTKGIGRGLVVEFVKRGCRVVYCGRSEASIPGAGGVVADVTRRAEIQEVWDFARGKHGTVDIWINNAGMYIRATMGVSTSVMAKPLQDDRFRTTWREP